MRKVRELNTEEKKKREEKLVNFMTNNNIVLMPYYKNNMVKALGHKLIVSEDRKEFSHSYS